MSDLRKPKPQASSSKPAASTAARNVKMGSLAAGTRKIVPTSSIKEKPVCSSTLRSKAIKNTTVIGDRDGSASSTPSALDFSKEYRQIACAQGLQAILTNILFESVAPRKEKTMDIQMAQLLEKYKECNDHLAKLYTRLKDISCILKLKNLEDMKNEDCSKFYEMVDIPNGTSTFQRISDAAQSRLDRLETINVDFGYNKESGHEQLLDAANETLNALEITKKRSNLDPAKCVEYVETQRLIEQYEQNKHDMESLKREYENDFPYLTKHLLFKASEMTSEAVHNSEEDL